MRKLYYTYIEGTPADPYPTVYGRFKYMGNFYGNHLCFSESDTLTKEERLAEAIEPMEQWRDDIIEMIKEK